jgi:hypothetical protein
MFGEDQRTSNLRQPKNTGMNRKRKRERKNDKSR